MQTSLAMPDYMQTTSCLCSYSIAITQAGRVKELGLKFQDTLVKYLYTQYYT